MVLDNSLTTDIVLQGFFIGVIIAVLCVAYNKLVLGRFVKALIKAEAVHPDFAKTFEQLNMKKNFLFAFALRSKGSLRKVVFESSEADKKGYFYIPEDKLYRAGRIYGGKDVDPLLVAAAIIVIFIFFTMVLLYWPVFAGQISSFGLGGSGQG